jgi:hypothetical protein
MLRCRSNVRGRRAAFALGSVVSALLAACGGGGGSDTGNTGGGSTDLTIGGTAAAGAAIAGKTVELKCSAGDGSATTGSDGSYSLTIAGGKLPCVARVTAPDGTVLHSMSAATGTRATVNITPVTELIVARVAGSDPAGYYSSFDSTAAAALTPAALSAAQTAVIDLLKTAGMDLNAIGDLVSTALKAKTGSTGGDAYDGALDRLAATLTSVGTTLATLSSAVASSSPSAPAGSTSGTASLPPDRLLQPAAANCAALRSGRYVVISPTPQAGLTEQMAAFTLDASTLQLSFDDGSRDTLTANGSCRYSNGSGADAVVSQSGVVVARVNDGSAFRLAIAVPAQSHTLAELAGDWNVLGFERNATGSYTPALAIGTFDAAGSISNVTACANDTTWSLKGTDCTAEPNPGSLKANADGGFDGVDPGSTTVSSRAFAFRAGGGDLMLIWVDGDGSFRFGTHRRTNTLPTVGTTTSNWNLYDGASLVSTLAVDGRTNTIQSVDTAAQSWVRVQKTQGGDDDHVETLLANAPRDGFTTRMAAQNVPAANGSTVNVNEFTAMTMRGMGFTPLAIPAPKLFDISVQQP